MEEMNNEVLTDVSEVIIDEVSDLTLGQKCVGYALVGFCAVGVITAGTAAVKLLPLKTVSGVGVVVDPITKFVGVAVGATQAAGGVYLKFNPSFG